MTEPSAPEVECTQEHASLRVSDVTAAIRFYTEKLGFRLGFTWGDPPSMAGVTLGDVQMFLEQGTPGPNGCSVYFVVVNADELYEFQRANGVDILETPGDRPYGLRDYRVRDLHGYELGFGQHLFNAGPPLEIERADVPLRLEKRLAALLHDLAEYKAGRGLVSELPVRIEQSWRFELGCPPNGGGTCRTRIMSSNRRLSRSCAN